MPVAVAFAGLALVTWLYLALAHGRFWDPPRLPREGHARSSWPAIVAVVPARDEALVLPQTLPTLLAQRYLGAFRVIVVDDESCDGTGELAARLGAQVVRASGPPPGSAGKVAAMAAGVEAAGEPDFLLFTDADIAWPSDGVAELVSVAVVHRLALTSQMVRLRVGSAWERLVIPAFVYFFAQLYPFSRVNPPEARLPRPVAACSYVAPCSRRPAGCRRSGVRASTTSRWRACSSRTERSSWV